MTHAAAGSTALWRVLLLGAYHGLNPGMGWLFAVALGMQERKGSAVAKALVPIALGHALAIGSVVLAAAFLGMALPREAIRYPVAAVLVGLGIITCACGIYTIFPSFFLWIRNVTSISSVSVPTGIVI